MSGFLLASCSIAAAIALLVLVALRCIRDRTPEVLVGPAAVLVVSIALATAATLSGLPVIEQAKFFIDHPGVF